MRRHLSSLRPATAVALAVVAVAACGGSSSSGSRAASGNSALKFAACVRAHGVPDYPDPRAGRITVDTHTLSESSAVVDAALGRCQHYQTASQVGLRLSPAQLTRVRAGALVYAKCMRAQGLTNYPDPVISVPPNGRGFEFGYSRQDLKADRAVFRDPAYAADNRTCGRQWAKYLPASLR
jgi:hypothetical protein